jgi:hypothetical protein
LCPTALTFTLIRVLLPSLIAAAALPLLADPGLAAALGPIDPRPGSWAEYLVRTRGHEDVRLRATVLPAEGEGRYWLELAMAAQGGIVAAAKLLVHGELSPKGIEGVYLMLAGQQPVEVPLDRVRLAIPNRKARSKLQSVELLASGSSGGHSVFPPGWDQGKGRDSAK